MKHIGLIIIAFFCSVVITTARADAPETLLNIRARNQKQSDIYSGTPFVRIDKTVGAPQDKGDKFVPIAFDKITNYPIQTPFGQKTEAAFVAHTTDFTFVIQILGDGSIKVKETIQFVNTKADTLFERVYTALSGQEIIITSLKRNHKPVNKQVIKNTDTVHLTDTEKLPSDIYIYEVDYIVKNAIKSNGKENILKYSLTGISWPLPVERFSAVVLFPQKTQLYHSEVVFGVNNVPIVDSAQLKTDDNGNIFMTLTRPLPAFADVKLVVAFNQKALPTPSLWEQVERHLNHVLFLLCLTILIIYTGITFLYLKYKKPLKYPLKDLTYYSFISLCYHTTGKINPTTLHTLCSYCSYLKKKARIISFFAAHSSPLLLRLYVFLNVMRKYFLTYALLIGLTVVQANKTGFPLSVTALILLCFTALGCAIWLYKYGEHLYIQKRLYQLTHTALDNDMAFGISKVSQAALFLRFYPYMLAQNQADAWINYFKKYYLDFSPFTFLKETDK